MLPHIKTNVSTYASISSTEKKYFSTKEKINMCNEHVNKKILTNYWFSLFIDSCLPLFSNYMFFLTALPLFLSAKHICILASDSLAGGTLFVLYHAGSKNWVALKIGLFAGCCCPVVGGIILIIYVV